MTDVDTAGFNEHVIQRSHEVPVVVDFWAEWCGPCKTLGPTLERLTNEAGGVFELAKVDVDQNQELAGQMGVQGIPTVVAFKDGQPVSQFTGALPEAKVKEWLAEFMPNPM
ncbi:MAG: thioredoxin, partial [Acidimicrobiia bacterium]|nr:thioredoxin [Acidimicrobiia bacterium]NNC92366.1 thioredoxin [Acidimicrobiia bacterium]